MMKNRIQTTVTSSIVLFALAYCSPLFAGTFKSDDSSKKSTDAEKYTGKKILDYVPAGIYSGFDGDSGNTGAICYVSVQYYPEFDLAAVTLQTNDGRTYFNSSLLDKKVVNESAGPYIYSAHIKILPFDSRRGGHQNKITIIRSGEAARVTIIENKTPVSSWSHSRKHFCDFSVKRNP